MHNDWNNEFIWLFHSSNYNILLLWRLLYIKVQQLRYVYRCHEFFSKIVISHTFDHFLMLLKCSDCERRTSLKWRHLSLIKSCQFFNYVHRKNCGAILNTSTTSTVTWVIFYYPSDPFDTHNRCHSINSQVHINRQSTFNIFNIGFALEEVH